MKLNILSLAVAGLLFGACSSEPVIIKKGEKFTFDSQEMNINYNVSSVLVNDEEKQVLIAPEGKAYLTLDATAQNSFYFLDLKDGEKALEKVDYLISSPFVKKIDMTKDANRSDLYLVDLANANYTIYLKSFGSDEASMKVGALKDEATVKVNEKMKAFVNDFAEGGHLLDIAKKYVKAGVNIYDIASEEGADVPMNPITKGLKITYISGNTYTCSSELGLEKVEVVWDGDYISKLVYVF